MGGGAKKALLQERGGKVRKLQDWRTNASSNYLVISKMKNLSHLNEIVASRTLELLGEAGNSASPVTVTIFRPEELPNSAGFSCSYSVRGLRIDLNKECRGDDSVQALLLTFAKIGADLYTCAEAVAGRLRWAGDGNLGFPVFTMLDEKVPEPKERLVF